MYCSKCGTKNSGKGLFCKKCGASLVEDALENQYTNQNNAEENNFQKRNDKNKTVNKTINKKVNKNSRNRKEKKDKKNNKEVIREIENRTEVVHKMNGFQTFIFFLMFLIIIGLVGGILGFGYYVYKYKTVEVPNVEDMNVEKATEIMESADLEVKLKEKEINDENYDNVVITQNKKTRVLKDTVVTLTIGKYNYQTIDNYIGMKIDESEKQLKKLGIEYEIKEVETLEKEGYVISQTPSIGSKITSSTKVLLIVSKKIDKEEMEQQKESQE